MDNCILKIEELIHSTGIFDTVVDCTYVLLCCGIKPEREINVRKQLPILSPTTRIKLIYNSGYKNCTITNSAQEDMSRAQLYIFQDALKNKYNRILLLEDDFIVLKPIPIEDINQIVTFIKEKDPSAYGLGNFSIPHISSLFRHHQRIIGNYLGAAHAVIYNKYFMNRTVEYYEEHGLGNMLMNDQLTSKLSLVENYRYYKPLIFQTFPLTENQINGWSKSIPSFCMPLVTGSIKMLKLDKKVQPGYKILYIIPYILYIILLIFIIILVYYFYSFFV
jgi:hypothetical protein